MEKRYPHIEFHRSPKPGQAVSLNLLFSMVETEWFFHMEDDWEFVKKGHFLRELFDIIRAEKTVLNATLRKWEPLEPELLRTTESGVDYVLHKYRAGLLPEVQVATDSSWFGWSLNPAINYTPLVRKLGPFPEPESMLSRFWDRPFAKEYMELGYRRASIYDDYMIHIGDESLYGIRRYECARERNCSHYPLECERCDYL